LWFGYLNYRGKQWNVVTALDIRAYADGLARLVSPRTGEFLAEGTIAQRRTHVVEFYRWANARGEVRIDARNLASVEASAGGSPAAPQPRGFTYEEWGRLRTSIGPLPSAPAYDPCTPEKAPCRDRLMCELAVHTGMRRHEICALTVYQIRALEAKLPPEAAGQEFSAKGLWLTVVKGGPRRARDAIVPVWLIRELLLYADGSERSRAAQVCARKNRGREPAELFLNHAWARHNPGKPFSAKRLTARFAELLVHAGFVERPNPSGTSVEKVSATERPTHSVHDLRHTAAVWRYMVERENGNPDPWKPVQVMLGHAHKETTIKIYLQITNTFEAEVSDRALRFFRGIAEAAPYNQVIS
jgi:integrase